MKLLILAAGKGERMGDLTKKTNKCMLPVVGSWTSLDHVISEVPNYEDTINEVVIVVGYRKEDIIDYVGKNILSIPVTYVAQEKQNGMVDALHCSQKAIGDDDFILMLGDELVWPRPYLHRMIGIFKQPHVWGCVGYIVQPSFEEVQKTFSIAFTGGSTQFIQMEEKPEKRPFGRCVLQGTGHGIFPAEFLTYWDKKNPYTHKRPATYVDMLTNAMRDHHCIELCHIGNRYFNINTPEEIEVAKRWCGGAEDNIISEVTYLL